MQEAMQTFAQLKTRSGRIISLGMKVAIAKGPVRRFIVGSPDYLLIDTMAGQTLQTLAEAEHHAERGEVILDSAAVAALERFLEISNWREDQDTGQKFAVVTHLNIAVSDVSWPRDMDERLNQEQLKEWLLPVIYQRLQNAQGMFLAELRPAVVLFLRFGGLDYDTDPQAPQKLNEFIIEIEHILDRYEGSLLQLTIGDKGSYLYVTFGAPIAHEDDAIRAGAAALDLQRLSEQVDFSADTQIGITLGRLYTGAYGGIARRTYGALGDPVNLSARLMTAAGAGQIFVHQTAREAIGDVFAWEELTPVQVKGKQEPVSLARLVSLKRERKSHLDQTKYHLPMVGRAEELAIVEEKLDLVLRGQGQIMGITAEAGMGKSRLVAEVIQRANARGLEGYGGECQSYGTDSSYLVWQSIWRDFFDLNPVDSLETQIAQAQSALEQIDSIFVPRLPLLGPVLNLSIPHNDLTHSLDAKLRKASLEGMLVTCLGYRAIVQPIFIVLEDCHWLDPLSHDLIEVIGKSLANWPVMLILVYRPPDSQRLQAPRVEQLPYFTELALNDFTPVESKCLIDLKLKAFFGENSTVPQTFIAEITRRAAGNPFYIEELLNYLQDLGVDLHDQKALDNVDLPTSIYSLILSRIDQLNEQQKITLRVASVIGRLFKAAMVWGIYPELGDLMQVESNLNVLSDLELTPLDVPEPEATYLFKHVLTQEVAYESLLYATRALLHDQIGQYIERIYVNNLERYYPLLAYHFEHSENQAKKCEYLLKAGIVAQEEYANSAAINYYHKALPLLSPSEQLDVMLKLGRILINIGQWADALTIYHQALTQAEDLEDSLTVAWCQTWLGELHWKQNLFDEASNWLQQAWTNFGLSGDLSGVAQVLLQQGLIAYYQGDYDQAVNFYEQSLSLYRQLDEKVRIGNVLNNLGAIAKAWGDYAQARQFYQETLEIRRTVNDKRGLAIVLNNLAELSLFEQTNYQTARKQLEEAEVIIRQIGDKYFLGIVVHTLANVHRDMVDYVAAYARYETSLGIWRDLGATDLIAELFEDMAKLLINDAKAETALQLAGQAKTLRDTIKVPLADGAQKDLEDRLAPAREAFGETQSEALWQAGQSLTLEEACQLASA